MIEITKPMVVTFQGESRIVPPEVFSKVFRLQNKKAKINKEIAILIVQYPLLAHDDDNG